MSSASLRGGALLTCKNQEFHVDTGSVVLFQPGDNHGRVKIDESTMDYWGLNIPQETMLTLTEEVTGKRELPGFTVNVLLDEEVNCYLRPLHEMIMAGAGDLDKEENLLLLISLLLRRYGQPFSRSIPPCRDEIECACRFIEEHYAERLSLEEICRCAGLSKSTLLRAFSREKGSRRIATSRISVSARRKNSSDKASRRWRRRCGRAFPTRAISRITSAASSAWPPAFTARFFLDKA